MRMSRAEVVELTKEMVALCVSLCPADVEFSAMDATRSDVDFLARSAGRRRQAGATTINVPDTVGYTLPTEYAALMDQLYEKDPRPGEGGAERPLPQRPGRGYGQLPGRGGARGHAGGGGHQRLGERAGNAALEEVAMALVTRRDILQRPCNIVTTEISRASRMVSSFTGH